LGHSKWDRRASLKKLIIGITIIVTTITIAIGAITVAIAGGVTDIATAVGGDQDRVIGTKAPGSKPWRFLHRQLLLS
jgi:hypothetical protein